MKTIIVAICVLLIGSLLLLLIPTTRDEIHWRWASFKDKVISFESYIIAWPEGLHTREAKSKQAELRSDDTPFLKAKQKNTTRALKAFLRDFQGHNREADAQTLLNELIKAIVVIDYPKVVYSGPSPYSRVPGPIFKWNTTFTETGGHTGFTLRSTNFNIKDLEGGTYSNSWSSSVDVRPGKNATVDYWCDDSHKWSGGTYHVDWVGYDDLGNPLRIIQEVKLAQKATSGSHIPAGRNLDLKSIPSNIKSKKVNSNTVTNSVFDVLDSLFPKPFQDDSMSREFR